MAGAPETTPPRGARARPRRRSPRPIRPAAETTDPPSTADGPPSTDDGETDEPTDTAEPTTGEIPPNCGDGRTDPDEACDDGNDVNADGCNSDCTISGSVQWFHSQAGGGMLTEEALGVTVDDQGRAYVAGYLYGGLDLEFWVRQYTEDGGLGWTQSLGGGAGNDIARAIARHGDTIYVAGQVATPTQSNNVWLRAFDLDGTPGLNLQYNSLISGNDQAHAVAVDPGGNIVMAGFESVSMQGPNGWISEYAPSGALVWSAGFASPGAGDDRGRAIAVDPAGNVAVVGCHTVAAQGRDIWVGYFDTNGAAQWTATHHSAELNDDEAFGVAFDPDGNVVVAGYEIDPAVNWRQWLRKYDPAGTEQWTQTWEGATGEGARPFAMAIDPVGDIIVTGQHRIDGLSHLLVRKHDADGNERWVTNIEGFPGTNQVGRAVAIGPGLHIWVAGGIDQGVDGRDLYVARLAP